MLATLRCLTGTLSNTLENNSLLMLTVHTSWTSTVDANVHQGSSQAWRTLHSLFVSDTPRENAPLFPFSSHVRARITSLSVTDMSHVVGGSQPVMGTGFWPEGHQDLWGKCGWGTVSEWGILSPYSISTAELLFFKAVGLSVPQWSCAVAQSRRPVSLGSSQCEHVELYEYEKGS